MGTIDLLAFVAFPYLCLAVFTVGHAYRYITDRYAWNSHGSELVYEPGYVTQTTIVRIETLLFDLKKDKLIWASQTDTTNPTGLEKTIADIAKATAFAIKKEGLIP